MFIQNWMSSRAVKYENCLCQCPLSFTVMCKYVACPLHFPGLFHWIYCTYSWLAKSMHNWCNWEGLNNNPRNKEMNDTLRRKCHGWWGPTLSSAKFLCSFLYPLANSECFSQGRIIATSIWVNRIVGWHFSKSIEKISSVHVLRGRLCQKHR